MTMLYILMAMLTAGVCIKLVHVLSPRGGNARVSQPDRFLLAVIVLVLPVAALATYLLIGRPDLKARQAIFDMTSDLAVRQAALLAKKPMAILAEQNPDDIGAYLSLAEVNRRIGRYDEEAKLLSHAVALAERADDPFLRHYAATLGQAQVRASNGVVGDDALETFAYVRRIYEADPLARHFEALALAQRGDAQKALSLWRELLSEGPSRAYWKDMVRKAIAATERDLRRAPQKENQEIISAPASE